MGYTPTEACYSPAEENHTLTEIFSIGGIKVVRNRDLYYKGITHVYI